MNAKMKAIALFAAVALVGSTGIGIAGTTSSKKNATKNSSTISHLATSIAKAPAPTGSTAAQYAAVADTAAADLKLLKADAATLSKMETAALKATDSKSAQSAIKKAYSQALNQNGVAVTTANTVTVPLITLSATGASTATYSFYMPAADAAILTKAPAGSSGFVDPLAKGIDGLKTYWTKTVTSTALDSSLASFGDFASTGQAALLADPTACQLFIGLISATQDTTVNQKIASCRRNAPQHPLPGPAA